MRHTVADAPLVTASASRFSLCLPTTQFARIPPRRNVTGRYNESNPVRRVPASRRRLRFRDTTHNLSGFGAPSATNHPGHRIASRVSLGLQTAVPHDSPRVSLHAAELQGPIRPFRAILLRCVRRGVSRLRVAPALVVISSAECDGPQRTCGCLYASRAGCCACMPHESPRGPVDTALM